MDKTLELVQSEQFGSVTCDFYTTDDQIWMTREQIGEALGYADPRVAIAKIHSRYQDRLDKFSVVTSLVTTDGKAYDTFLYSPKGVYEICRWSRQPKAHAFYDWVYDILEQLRTQKASWPLMTAQVIAQAFDFIGRLTDISATMETRLTAVEKHLSARLAVDALQESAVAEFPGQITLPLEVPEPVQDDAADALRLVYKWALNLPGLFYGRNSVADIDCIGRWDKSNWRFVGIFPEIVRGLLSNQGYDPNTILRIWRDRNWLTTENKTRFTKTYRMGKAGPKRLICIKRSPIDRLRRRRDKEIVGAIKAANSR